jgi:hypothetical protein
MIISHDRQTLFIGVPKNGSQTARAVLGQFGIDLVGELGRHPTVSEAIRLADALFPGETIAPTTIYTFGRDPVERFCSAVEFHKRCLPNSFIQLFPDRFVGIERHPRWFEPDPNAIDLDMRAVIDSVPPLEILAALSPPLVPGVLRQPRCGNLSFYRPQSEWLDDPRVTVLPFADYEPGLREIVDWLGGDGSSLEVPRMNASVDPLPQLDGEEAELVGTYYLSDYAA